MQPALYLFEKRNTVPFFSWSVVLFYSLALLFYPYGALGISRLSLPPGFTRGY